MDTRLTAVRTENGMETAMRNDIDELSRMTVGQLRQKYPEAFREESRSNHKQFLFRSFGGRIIILEGILLGVPEVPSSNLGSPTKFLKELQAADSSHPGFWSPIGVQNGRQPMRPWRCYFNNSEFSEALSSYKNPTNPTIGI